MGERNSRRKPLQALRAHRIRVVSAGEYEEALMTISFVEALIAWIILASVVVGGVLFGIGCLIMKLHDNHWEI